MARVTKLELEQTITRLNNELNAARHRISELEGARFIQQQGQRPAWKTEAERRARLIADAKEEARRTGRSVIVKFN